MSDASTPSFLIRSAQPADAEAISTLVTLPAGARERVEGIRAILREPTHSLCVAEAAGQVVGVVHGVVMPQLNGALSVQIFAFGVVDQHTRGEVGRRLLAAIEVWAAACGCTAVSLRGSNPPPGSPEFWATMGYSDRTSLLVFGKTLAG